MSFFAKEGNILDSEPCNRGDSGMAEAEEFFGETADVIQESRERYGRYFGICSSYHHLKACVCKNCPSYPGGAGIFCARGKSPVQGKKRTASGENWRTFQEIPA